MTTRAPARRRPLAIALAGVLVGALAPLGAQAAPEPLLLETGHVDAFNVHVVDGVRRSQKTRVLRWRTGMGVEG